MTFYQKRLRTLAPAKQKTPMKTKLKLCALITFALAVGLRLEAGTVFFVDLHDYGGPGDFSAPVGAPALDSQVNYVIVAFGTGDINASPTLYFGGIGRYSGFGSDPGNWNGNGNLTFSIPYIFGTSSGDGWYPSTGPVIGDYNGDGIPDIVVGAGSGGVNGVGTVQVFSITPTGITPQTTIGLTTSIGTDPAGITVGPDGSVIFSCASGGTGSGAVPILRHEGFDDVTGDLVNFVYPAGQEPVGSFAISTVNGLPRSVQKTGAKANGPIAGANSITNYTLYGVTFFGGTNGNGPGTGGYGTVYQVNSDSSGFQTLHVFSSQRATNGYGPAGGMVLSGNTLYGTTSGGGSGGSGTLFKMDTSGSNFMVLKSFSAWGTQIVNGYYNYTNSDGMAPEGDLILSGDTLYGTTLEGGTNGGGGVVYSINTNGGNFTLLHSFSSPNNNGSGVFTNVDGGGTRAGLMLTGHVLFGTTPYGGPYGGGTVFAIILPSSPSLKIAPAGGNFAVSWPSSATNFMLQRNLTLNSLTWSNFNGAVNDNGSNKSVSIIPAAGNAFFRLLNTNGS